MNAESFRHYFETLQLDPNHGSRESLRATAATGPTLAFSGLPSLELGATTNPEFELGDTIGEGGMGVVRSANQLALHREVAVKTLRRERASDAARQGLLHEALVTGGLEHPNVVPVYTLGQTADGAPVIVMKRIEGVPWSACIDDPTLAPDFDADDPLGWHLAIFGELCQAVHFAHSRGIIHRDIKPENVMIGAFGEVYLVDWGIAVTIDDDKASFLVHARSADGVSGTPAYMAPEMTTGVGADIGVHTDVYLLGATLVHVLTGAPPHRGSSLFEIMFHAYEAAPPSLDAAEELVAIVHRAMARDAADRFESVEALRRALLDFDRHRASIALAAEAGERLRELRRLVVAHDADDDGSVRGLAGECRFGFEQALRVWPQNDDARAARDEVIRELTIWEIDSGNARAAEANLAMLAAPDAELCGRLDELRDELARKAADIEKLRAHEREYDLSAGAGFRAAAAVAAVALWTFIPLAAGFSVHHGWTVITPTSMVVHGVTVLLFIVGIVGLLRRELLQNQANRRIVRLLVVFAVWVPLFRIALTQTSIGLEQGLALEDTVYGLIFAGITIMSDRLAVLGVAVYLAAGLLATWAPSRVYELTAAANFLAIGWLAIMWNRQRG